MKESDWERVIAAAMEPASRYLESLPERAVHRPTDPNEIRDIIGGPLAEVGTEPARVTCRLRQQGNLRSRRRRRCGDDGQQIDTRRESNEGNGEV